jgi:hypothetical protein
MINGCSQENYSFSCATYTLGTRQISTKNISQGVREWYQLPRSEETRVKRRDQGTEGWLGAGRRGIRKGNPSTPSIRTQNESPVLVTKTGRRTRSSVEGTGVTTTTSHPRSALCTQQPTQSAQSWFAARRST